MSCGVSVNMKNFKILESSNNKLFLLISESLYIKKLCPILNSDISSDIHIDTLYCKLSKFCGISLRLKYKLNLHTAKIFYFSYFLGSLSYCIVAWGGLLTSSQRGSKLLKLQDRIIKNLFSRFYPTLSSNELYCKLYLLKLPDIYKIRLATLMYKMLKLNRFPELLTFINLSLGTQNYPTRQSQYYLLPFPRVNCIRESFMYQIISIWNELDPEIKNLETLSSFKNACYQFYINKYY